MKAYENSSMIDYGELKRLLKKAKSDYKLMSH